MVVAGSVAPRLLALLVLGAFWTAPVCAQAQQSAVVQPWDPTVVALQGVATVAHGAGHAAGMLAGAIVAFTMCPSLFSQCPKEKQPLAYLLVTSSAVVVGTVVGGLATWGVGRAAGAPGLLLPTAAFGAIGHVAGALTIVGLGASPDWRTQRSMWIVAPLVAGVLGGGGAIVGFQRSF